MKKQQAGQDKRGGYTFQVYPLPSCPAGLLIRGSAQRQNREQLLHEKDTHTGRPALFSYVRTRSGARAARTTG